MRISFEIDYTKLGKIWEEESGVFWCIIKSLQTRVDAIAWEIVGIFNMESFQYIEDC